VRETKKEERTVSCLLAAMAAAAGRGKAWLGQSVGVRWGLASRFHSNCGVEFCGDTRRVGEGVRCSYFGFLGLTDVKFFLTLASTEKRFDRDRLH